MLVFLALVFLAVVAFGAYKVYEQYKAQKVATGVGGVSAFAKLAEADGKIIALKIAAEAKKVEALAVHATLDEIHKILG